MESALESFDFLNTSDFDDEDTGDDTAALSMPQRSPLFDVDGERIGCVGNEWRHVVGVDNQYVYMHTNVPLLLLLYSCCDSTPNLTQVM